jgi:glucose-6-phosphate 1-dehydrogenase
MFRSASCSPPETPPVPADTLLLFGATGDLAQRMLLPSLFGLDGDGLLPAALRIVGTARSNLDESGFRAAAGQALERFVDADRRPPDRIERFLSRLSYVPLDASDPSQFGRLAEAVQPDERGLAIFLSTAPSLFSATIGGLAGAGLSGPKVRLALEKPLGTDLASSREINDALPPSSRKNARSGSTIISARRRSRTCSRCASAIACSSPCGTRPASITSRSPSRNRRPGRPRRLL